MVTLSLAPNQRKWCIVRKIRKRRGKRLLLLLSVPLALAGSLVPGNALAGTLSASAKPAPSSLTWGPCPDDDVVGPLGQECATVTVPLDYRYPSGQQIQVGISRIKAADPAKRRGVLLTNPGGPGGAGLNLPASLKLIGVPQSVFDAYDIIGMDPRGVGTSAPVTCGLTADQAEQAYVPLTQNHSFDDTVAFQQQVAGGCATNSGSELPFVTTLNTARDMDWIRAALGEQKISYFAYSYGTYLGAVYASLYPNSTDRFVLDSSVDSTGVWRQVFRNWGSGGEIRFPDFAAFAAANDGTYHLGATTAAVRQTYLDLAGQLATQPFTVPDDSVSDVAAQGDVLGDALYRETVLGALSDPDAVFPELAHLLQLIKGAPAGSASARPRVTVPDDNEAASGIAVVCDDVQWSRTPVQYQTELNSDVSNFPLFGEVGSNIWPCAFWPNNPVERPATIGSTGPADILMIQNRRDPLTPYTPALNLRNALGGRAKLVSVDQGGHGAAYLNTNTCASDAATNYLVSGTYPASDTNCAAQPSSATSASSLKSLHDPTAQRLRQAMVP